MAADRAYVRNPALLWRRTFDRVVVLVPGTDDCVMLAGTGTNLWDCFAQPRSIDEAADVLADAFSAPPAVVREDVAPAVEALVADGVLVEAGPM